MQFSLHFVTFLQHISTYKHAFILVEKGGKSFKAPLKKLVKCYNVLSSNVCNVKINLVYFYKRSKLYGLLVQEVISSVSAKLNLISQVMS